jgi:hypothetical protein
MASVLDVNHRMRAAIFVAIESRQIVLRPANSTGPGCVEVDQSTVVATAILRKSTADVHRRALLQLEDDVIAVNVVSHTSNRVLIGLDNELDTFPVRFVRIADAIAVDLTGHRIERIELPVLDLVSGDGVRVGTLMQWHNVSVEAGRLRFEFSSSQIRRRGRCL